MPTYYIPEPRDIELTNPTIIKTGVFGFSFDNNSSGNFVGVVTLYVEVGAAFKVKAYSVPLSSPPEDAPNVLNQLLTDEERASLIDAWVLDQLEQFLI